MQQHEIELTSTEAIKAMRESNITAYFLEPKSPSDVAREIKQPANLVHHHAKRLASLGILIEVKREDGKVYYQLAAKSFKHRRELLSVDEVEGEDIRELSSAFMKAYERSERINASEDPDYSTYGFASEPLPPTQNHNTQPNEARPAHFQARTFRLSGASYQALVLKLAALIRDATAERSDDAELCTIALLAFDGGTRVNDPKENSDSRHLNSFIPMNIVPDRAP